MKNFILLILLIFISLPCQAKDTIYLNEKWDKGASKLLYEYVLKNADMTPEKAYEAFGYRLSDVRAVFYDLNSDGINEIIGYIDVPYSYSMDGANLFILKRSGTDYEDISGINIRTGYGLQILDTKTLGFYDLIVIVTMQHKPVIAKYKKTHYKSYYEYYFPD